MVHIVADFLIYLFVRCVCEEGEMCRKTSKRQALDKKKKKKNRGGCHFRKKRIFWLINTQEKDEELCDFEDDESAREQRLRGNKREE